MKRGFMAMLAAAAIGLSGAASAAPETGAQTGPGPGMSAAPETGAGSRSGMSAVSAEGAGGSGRERMVESLSLNRVSMKEAARLISLATEIPIVVSAAAASVEVDVHLGKVTAEVALRSICQAAGLWYQRNGKDGVLNVMTLDEFKNTIRFDRSERVEVVQILYPSARDVGDAVHKLYVDRVVWLDPRRSSGDRRSEIVKALKRMDLLGDRGSLDLGEDRKAAAGEDDDEDEDDDVDSEKRDAREALAVDLAKVDAASLKKMFSMGQKAGPADVRAEKLLNAPGVVFVSVLPENNSLMLRSGDSAAVDDILKLVERLDRPVPQVLLEVKVLSVLLDDGRSRSLDLLFAGDEGRLSGGFSGGAFGGASSFERATGRGLDHLVDALDPRAAVFKAVHRSFKLRLELLEKDERVTQLATPNLVVSNNESTTLFIGTETTVMEKAQSTTTYTEVSSGTFQPNVSWQIEAPRRRIGTSLLLTPKIHADRSVTIRLLQEKSTLGQNKQNTYSGGTGSGAASQFFTSQDIDMQRIVTTVVGRDREFLVIGGMITEKAGRRTERVPGLSAIPWLGELLFSRLKAVRQREEIVIVVRPFVMTAPGDGQAVSQAYLDRMSQHPAARNDLPSLGVNAPADLAKPGAPDPDDPWLARMLRRVRGWEVDDRSEFDADGPLERQERRRRHREALQEMERIRNHEK